MDSLESLKKRAGYFPWMLDEYIGNAYVSDIETYELLYLNKTDVYKRQGSLCILFR